MVEHETPVLVAGGSLVGMFAAALLARHGIAPLVVERHPGSAIHPRAAMIYQRTMEIIRALGIEDPVRQESYRRFEPDGAIMSVESIAGNELNWDIPDPQRVRQGSEPGRAPVHHPERARADAGAAGEGARRRHPVQHRAGVVCAG